MNNIPLTEEQAYAQQLAAGNEDAFAALYVLYQPELYRFMLTFTSLPPLAEDLVQEIFLKVWEQRTRFAAVDSFRAYLFIMARNHTLTTLKKAFRNETATMAILEGFRESRNPVEEHIQDKEYDRFLQQALSDMPARTREIFYRCRERKESYEEVASALGISRNAVKNHMVRSMKLLGDAVKKEMGISLPLFLLLLSRYK
ncbi:RNA polymerase sigma factor [Chitinophaga arvensicola]|uniref:RNA polymerase sigma factor n=1 Tax=Chitinophaga arvensicola TaxID=29529 RepID=UPI0015A6706F|nr:sigma-70 family RNA polymerase sigma factor [Chitinophaga arvensicola]